MKFQDMHGEVKKINRIQKILISIICIILIIGSIIFFTGDSSISKFGYNFFTMLRYSLIDHPIETIKDWGTSLSNLKSVQEENDTLKSIISSQDMYKAELDEKTRLLNEMEELMNFESNATFTKINASVIYRDMSTWSNTITINKGSKQGVEKDMAVISSKGLIGKVTSVSGSSCKVKLLTSETKDVSVAVKVELKEGSTAGILQYYDSEKEAYIVQIFDANAKIETGMKLITSGSGGVFPSGVLVGEVKEIDNLYDSKGKIIAVTPSVDFNSFNYVAVIKLNS